MNLPGRLLRTERRLVIVGAVCLFLSLCIPRAYSEETTSSPKNLTTFFSNELAKSGAPKLLVHVPPGQKLPKKRSETNSPPWSRIQLGHFPPFVAHFTAIDAREAKGTETSGSVAPLPTGILVFQSKRNLVYRHRGLSPGDQISFPPSENPGPQAHYDRTTSPASVKVIPGNHPKGYVFATPNGVLAEPGLYLFRVNTERVMKNKDFSSFRPKGRITGGFTFELGNQCRHKIRYLHLPKEGSPISPVFDCLVDKPGRLYVRIFWHGRVAIRISSVDVSVETAPRDYQQSTTYDAFDSFVPPPLNTPAPLTPAPSPLGSKES